MKKSMSAAAWIQKLFEDQLVPDDVRRSVRTTLRVAGITEVTSQNERLTQRLAARAIQGASDIQSQAVLATVVSADSACPRCGSAMNDARIGKQAAKLCSNARCRTAAWVH